MTGFFSSHFKAAGSISGSCVGTEAGVSYVQHSPVFHTKDGSVESQPSLAALKLRLKPSRVDCICSWYNRGVLNMVPISRMH